MPLRIGFDLDGVLADLDSELIRQAEQLFGEKTTRHIEPPAPDLPPSPVIAVSEIAGEVSVAPTTAADTGPVTIPPLLQGNLTMRQQRRLWRHVETIENFWERLEEHEPGAIQRLATLAANRRWEIIFLTKRPQSAGVTAQLQSQRWLQSKGFPLPSVFVVQRSRGGIAVALGLDIVIDDTPRNCLDVVVDSKAGAILVWRADRPPPPAARSLGIGVVKTVGDCLDILAQLDPAEDKEPGAAHRLKQLLGLEQPATRHDRVLPDPR